MNGSEPAFYNNLSGSLAESWRLIAAGVADRRSPFHHPTVATIGLDGRPRLRTVILRGCDAASRQLRFHTDRRSEKLQEIIRDPRLGLHFYDPAAKVQLRVDGLADLHLDDTIADSAWKQSQLMSRQCYGIQPGPGVSLDAPDGFRLPEISETGTAAGRAHFCAVSISVSSLEWLYLAGSGHRRARFEWQNDGTSQRWLTP